MGIWGHNNFESDLALDVLGSLIQRIIYEIEETFTNESSDSVYGSGGEDIIMANLDILGTLLEHYHIHPDIKKEKIIDWKQNFLGTYDRITENPEGDDIEFVNERRKIIEATFDRLIDIMSQIFK